MALDTGACWHVEHGNITRLLDFLEAQHRLLRPGARASYELMLDVTSFLNHFPDRYHCSRENVAFSLLALSDPGLRATTDRLLQEHRELAVLGEKLHALLWKGAGSDIEHRPHIEAALSSYLTRQRDHIAVEEQEVLPRALELLTPEQWKSVADAAPPGPEPFRSYHRRRHDPSFGSEAELRYRELSRRLSAWRSTQPDPLPDLNVERESVSVRTREPAVAELLLPPRRPAARTVRGWRLLARQAGMLLALVLSYLQYYFLDVHLKIFRLHSLMVYLFR